MNIDLYRLRLKILDLNMSTRAEVFREMMKEEGEEFTLEVFEGIPFRGKAIERSGRPIQNVLEGNK